MRPIGHDRTTPDSEAMSEHAQLVRELDEALAPGHLLLLCKPAIGPPDGRLAGVAWLPPAVRLRAHTETAFAREGGRSPGSICALRTLELPGRPVIDIVEAQEFASLVLRRNPRWVCVLLTGTRLAEPAEPSVGELVVATPQWRSPPPAEYAGPQLARGCSHQSFGRLSKLFGRLDAPASDVPSDTAPAPISGAEVREEWRQISALLSLCAALPALGGWPASCLHGGDAEGVCASLAAAARDTPFPTDAERAEWSRLCEVSVKAADTAGTAARKGKAADLRQAGMQQWLHELDAALLDPTPPSAEPAPASAPTPALVELLERLGGPVEASRVVHGVRGGSHMYGLATSASDEDYHFVFLSPATQLLELSPPPRHFERHVCMAFGSDKSGELESTGVELGEFVMLLAKGNPRNVELLWLDEAGDASAPAAVAWPWNQLVMIRETFRTQVAFTQYLGLAGERLHRAQRLIEGGGGSGGGGGGGGGALDAAALSKLFYHAFRVLFETARLRAGEALHVAPRGAERAFIMRVRHGPLEGPELAPAALLARGLEQLRELKELGAATLPAATDRRQLLEFVVSVRLSQLAAEVPPRVAAALAETAAGGVADGQGAVAASSAAAAASDAEAGAAPLPASRCASSASEEAEGDAEYASVLSAIARLEAAEGVRVVFALEQGSKMRGTDHAHSDRDVLVVFAHPRTTYFSFRPPRPTLRLTYPPCGEAAAEVELLGYEARHFFGMCAGNNPSVFEALLSPIVYRSHGPWLERARALVDRVYDAPSLAASWRHHARKNYREHVCRSNGGESGVLRKKYLHVVRPLLSARWLDANRANGGTAGEWPPLEWSLLLAQSPAVPPALRALLEAMLEPAERPRLRERGPRIAELDAFIDDELRADAAAPPVRRDEASKVAAAEGFDRLCMAALDDATSG